MLQKVVQTDCKDKTYFEGKLVGLQQALKYPDKELNASEWSEEDEKFFKTALWHISYSVSNGDTTDCHCDTTNWLKGVKERLKSLRPQSHWKPSEEQMKALEYFVQKHKAEANAATCVWQDYENLVSLRNDLKKLM